MKHAGRKLSSSNYGRLMDASYRRATPDEHRDSQVAEFAVIARDNTLDDIHSPFFQRDDGSLVLGESDTETLDTLLEKHGLKALLQALAHLLESRVDAGLVNSGRSLFHLAREDAFARAAQRVTDLTYLKEISEL